MMSCSNNELNQYEKNIVNRGINWIEPDGDHFTMILELLSFLALDYFVYFKEYEDFFSRGRSALCPSSNATFVMRTKLSKTMDGFLMIYYPQTVSQGDTPPFKRLFVIFTPTRSSN